MSNRQERIAQLSAKKSVRVPMITILEFPGEPNKRVESTYTSSWNRKTKTDTESHPVTFIQKRRGGRLLESYIEIRGPLRQILQNIFRNVGYVRLSLDGDPLVFHKPFLPLVHQSDAIFDYEVADSDDSTVLDALEQLWLFMDGELKTDIASFKSCNKLNMFQYNKLWAAIIPGELALKRDQDFSRCYQILGCQFGKESCTIQGNVKPF
jgi:hypothetical protein